MPRQGALTCQRSEISHLVNSEPDRSHELGVPLSYIKTVQVGSSSFTSPQWQIVRGMAAGDVECNQVVDHHEVETPRVKFFRVVYPYGAALVLFQRRVCPARSTHYPRKELSGN